MHVYGGTLGPMTYILHHSTCLVASKEEHRWRPRTKSSSTVVAVLYCYGAQIDIQLNVQADGFVELY